MEEIGKKGVGEITLYTLTYCKYCQALKKALNQLLVPFKEVDVDKNEKMGDWLEANLKTESYPIIFCKKPNQEYIYILSDTNLDTLNGVRIFHTIEEALELLLTYYYEI